jgi:hypothetical protein
VIGLLLLIGRFVFGNPQRLYVLTAFLLGAVLPGMALLLAAVPFAKASRPVAS